MEKKLLKELGELKLAIHHWVKGEGYGVGMHSL